MAGPSPAFLAQINAGLQPTLDMPADTITPTGASMAPAPAVYNAPPAGSPWEPTDPLAGIRPTNAPGAGALTGYDPLKADAPTPTREPVSFTRGEGEPRSASGGPSPSLPANPGDVEFTPVTSGGAPAREVPIRGPKQNALLDQSFEWPFAAAQSVGQRSSEQADRERDMYERQAEKFEAQQDAMMRVQARRESELRQLRSDYMQTIDRLSNFQIDNNRAWNNSSTMDKIGATVLIMLGAAAGGPKSLTLQAVQKRIADDVEDQKRSYEMGLNLAKGQQTAYAMALEQYGSEDAAYHAAMAAGQQAVAAKIAGMGAQWKGTDAKNKAESLMGEIMMAADQNRAAGLKYLQPTPGGTKYAMTIRGQRVPGLVSEERAQGYAVEHGVKPAERVDEKLVQGGIDQTTAAMKLRAEQAKAEKQHAVVLPDGEILYAQNDKQAEKAQTLSQAVSTANDLVREAKQIRKGNEWWVPGTKARQRLEAIQSELTLAFKDRGGLGALSGPDMDLALGATGEITARTPNADAKLDSFANHTAGALRNYVRTIPGAPAKSAGVMPAGFKPAGER